MFSRKRNYDNCIQKVRLDVGTLVGLQKDDEAYITLRELPTLEMLRLKEASEHGEKETLEVFRELLPSIVADHNFYEDEDGKVKMKDTDLASLVFESVDLTLKVVRGYTEAAFFTRRRKDGDSSPASAGRSSTEDGAGSSTGNTDTGSAT